MHLPEFQEFIGNMGSDYYGDTYSLISKNCNHFTQDVCMRLTGKQIPGWVNRLAQLGNFPTVFFLRFIACFKMLVFSVL